MIKNKTTIISLLALSFSNYAFAENNQISINKSIINFNKNGQISQKFEVRNGFPNRTYIETELYEIMNAGTSKENKVLYKAMDENTDYGKKQLLKYKKNNITLKSPFDAGIHFNPNKFILEESGNFLDTKTISILNLNVNLNKERVFRLKTYPVVSGFKSNNKTSGIKILMQYEVLILIQPDNPILKYSIDYSDKKLTIKNNGNSNFLLDKIEQCDKNNENCYELAPKRIYADAEYSFSLKYNTEVKSIVDFGGDRETITFKK